MIVTVVQKHHAKRMPTVVLSLGILWLSSTPILKAQAPCPDVEPFATGLLAPSKTTTPTSMVLDRKGDHVVITELATGRLVKLAVRRSAD